MMAPTGSLSMNASPAATPAPFPGPGPAAPPLSNSAMIGHHAKPHHQPVVHVEHHVVHVEHHGRAKR